MTDTPENIKALQLKIWLSKTPEQRLYQQLKDNEELYHFWANVKPVKKKDNEPGQRHHQENNNR